MTQTNENPTTEHNPLDHINSPIPPAVAVLTMTAGVAAMAAMAATAVLA